MATRQTIEGLVDEWEAPLREAFLLAIQNVVDRVQLDLIAQYLQAGNIQAAVQAVDLDPTLFRPFDAALTQAYEAGGAHAMTNVPAAKLADGRILDIMFNVRNLRAESWLRDHSSRLIQEVTEDQREAVRSHLTAGMARGDNPRKVALELVGKVDARTGKRTGGVIGMTSTHEKWSQNYAEELASADPAKLQSALNRKLRDKRFDAAIRKAIATGQPVKVETAEKMVRLYRNRATRLRAEMLARTEAMGSLHAAQEQAFSQAMDAGQVDVANVEKIWRSASDRRVRDTHRHLNGQRKPFAEPFVSSSGARLRYPGDPTAPAAEIIGCRCTVEIRTKFLKGTGRG